MNLDFEFRISNFQFSAHPPKEPQRHRGKTQSISQLGLEATATCPPIRLRPPPVPGLHLYSEPRVGAFTGGAWHPDMTLSSNRRRQRSELRFHPKEEAMSHALAKVLHRGRKAASNVVSACLASSRRHASNKGTPHRRKRVGRNRTRTRAPKRSYSSPSSVKVEDPPRNPIDMRSWSATTGRRCSQLKSRKRSISSGSRPRLTSR